MRFIKTILASIFCFALLASSSVAQVPDKPSANSDLRVWLGGGLVSGAENDYTPGKNSLAIAGGLYFPSNVIPVPGFHSFVGAIYNRTGSTTLEGADVRTWDVQFRFVYYMKLSDTAKGLFLLFGPDYQHVQNDDPLQFSGTLFQASTGIGGYVGLGATKETRISLVIERDFTGDINHRDWRVLAGFSRGFDPNIF